MTDPVLQAISERLTRIALEMTFVIEAIDNILNPTGPESEPPKPVKWGEPKNRQGLQEFLASAKPTRIRVDESVLVDRAARRMRGELLDPLVYETGTVETDVEPADELDGVFDRLRQETPMDDDDHDPNEGRFDREG
jgi:hypothetical protein